jgi:hypothetical protein
MRYRFAREQQHAASKWQWPVPHKSNINTTTTTSFFKKSSQPSQISIIDIGKLETIPCSIDKDRERIQHPSWRHLPSACSPRGAIIARHWPSPPRLRRYRRRRHPHPSASVRLPMPTLPLCATNHHLTFRLPLLLLLLLLLRRRRVVPILKSRPRPWCTSPAKK